MGSRDGAAGFARPPPAFSVACTCLAGSPSLNENASTSASPLGRGRLVDARGPSAVAGEADGFFFFSSHEFIGPARFVSNCSACARESTMPKLGCENFHLPPLPDAGSCQTGSQPAGSGPPVYPFFGPPPPRGRLGAVSVGASYAFVNFFFSFSFAGALPLRSKALSSRASPSSESSPPRPGRSKQPSSSEELASRAGSGRFRGIARSRSPPARGGGRTSYCTRVPAARKAFHLPLVGIQWSLNALQ